MRKPSLFLLLSGMLLLTAACGGPAQPAASGSATDKTAPTGTPTPTLTPAPTPETTMWPYDHDLA